MVLTRTPRSPQAVVAQPSVLAPGPSANPPSERVDNRIPLVLPETMLAELRPGIDELRPGAVREGSRGYRQFYKSVLVYDSGISVILDRATNQPRVIGAVRKGIDISVKPTVPADEAKRLAFARFRLDSANDTKTTPELLLYPGAMPYGDWKLAWMVRIPPKAAFVDARTGAILYADDGIRH